MTGIDTPEATPAMFESAWNAHDMEAFAELFHPDATFVTRVACTLAPRTPLALTMSIR